MAKDDDDFVKEIEALANESPPPKDKKEPKKDTRKATVTRLPSRKPLQPRIETLYVSLGMMIVPIDQTCGMATAQNAPSIAAAWSNLADQNPRVKQALERILSGGAWGEVFMAHMPLLMVVLTHHKMLPPQMQNITVEQKEESNGNAGDGSAAATS